MGKGRLVYQPLFEKISPHSSSNQSYISGCEGDHLHKNRKSPLGCQIVGGPSLVWTRASRSALNLQVVIREYLNLVYGQRQTSDSHWEFLKIKNTGSPSSVWEIMNTRVLILRNPQNDRDSGKTGNRFKKINTPWKFQLNTLYLIYLVYSCLLSGYFPHQLRFKRFPLPPSFHS